MLINSANCPFPLALVNHKKRAADKLIDMYLASGGGVAQRPWVQIQFGSVSHDSVLFTPLFKFSVFGKQKRGARARADAPTHFETLCHYAREPTELKKLRACETLDNKHAIVSRLWCFMRRIADAKHHLGVFWQNHHNSLTWSPPRQRACTAALREIGCRVWLRSDFCFIWEQSEDSFFRD